MTHDIYPCLWFDKEGKQAAELYCSVFKNSKITTDTPMVVTFQIEGKEIMALNGGPMFQKNPSISLFITCTSAEEIQELWDKLIDGGKALMMLDAYPWAEKYGWLQDKFGMTWQLMLGSGDDDKIIPAFLFVGDQFGKAKQAIETYTSLFNGSNLDEMQLYDKEEGQQEGTVKFARFHLGKTPFAAMDGFGTHDFTFNEGISLVVECDSQDEIDFYWQKLTEDGAESMCGWLRDKYGVSWQIIPKNMGMIMKDHSRAPRAMQALMKMKKIDIATLENA